MAEEFIFGGDMEDAPEPIKALLGALQGVHAEHQRAHMEGELMEHEFHDFINALDKDQLTLLTQFTKIVTRNSESGVYYTGYFNALLEQKFNICPSCKSDHDEALSDLTREP